MTGIRWIREGTVAPAGPHKSPEKARPTRLPQCAAIRIDPLTPEDPGLPMKRQMVTEPDTMIHAINRSIGNPPGTVCPAAWARAQLASSGGRRISGAA